MRFWIALALLLAACSPLVPGRSSTSATPQPTTGISQETAARLNPYPSGGTPAGWQSPSSPTAPDGPITLWIWVPPQLDPASHSAASARLRARLDEFSQRRPGVQVEVRTKAVDGAGGLLDSLATASAAAPATVPDLIALPREQLEPAGLKGLIQSYDDLSRLMDDSDWFAYAQDLARLQNSVYGLPFAGDALMLVHRTSNLPDSPKTWQDVLQLQTPQVFPAADPLALFSLAAYQAAGGAIRDNDGRPALEVITLTQVLTYYASASQVGVMPEWLTQIPDEDSAWRQYQDNRTDLVATWASLPLSAPETGNALAPLPSPDGNDYTLATGWVWALAARTGARQQLAVELAEFLVDKEFLASWTQPAGFLPVRPSTLDHWLGSDRPAIRRAATSAHLLPGADILSSLGSVLQTAVVQVLKHQTDPVSAAQAAAGGLTSP
jgi:multiple sugar transport system substrate-binding protein